MLNIEDTWVYLGLSSLVNADENPYLQILKPKRVTRHKEYNKNSALSDDIAIVTLERPVEWSFGVGPVCMPDNTIPDTFSTSTLVILGFGQLKENGDSAKVLLKAQVEGLEKTQCTTYFEKVKSFSMKLLQNKFCVVSGSSNNMDTCPGDSGGPVIYKSYRDYFVGIVSAGLDCGVKIPSLNIQVSLYEQWIKENLID